MLYTMLYSAIIFLGRRACANNARKLGRAIMALHGRLALLGTDRDQPSGRGL